MMPQSIVRPQRVLYGFSRLHESLCFGDETQFRELSEEVERVKGLTSVRSAVALAAELKHTHVPGIPEDLDELEEDGVSLDDSYTWADQGEVHDGDWPPMPTALSLDAFDDEDDEAWELIFSAGVGGENRSTIFNGDYLKVPPQNEAALLSVFERLGVSYVRDDAVVDILSA
jgi:hypothetical protein